MGSQGLMYMYWLRFGMSHATITTIIVCLVE